MPTVSNVSAATNAASSLDGSLRLPVQTLDQQDFLLLLTKQMTSQDPLNPKQDTEFIGQMAQFTALEQTKGILASQQFGQAATLIGRTVEVKASEDETVEGVVSGVQMLDGKPYIAVGGDLFELSQVVSVRPAPTQTADTNTDRLTPAP